MFIGKVRICKTNNEFQIGSVDIGLENVAVAAARVVEGPSRRDKKGDPNVDVYNLVRNSLFS